MDTLKAKSGAVFIGRTWFRMTPGPMNGDAAVLSLPGEDRASARLEGELPPAVVVLAPPTSPSVPLSALSSHVDDVARSIEDRAPREQASSPSRRRPFMAYVVTTVVLVLVAFAAGSLSSAWTRRLPVVFHKLTLRRAPTSPVVPASPVAVQPAPQRSEPVVTPIEPAPSVKPAAAAQAPRPAAVDKIAVIETVPVARDVASGVNADQSRASGRSRDPIAAPAAKATPAAASVAAATPRVMSAAKPSTVAARPQVAKTKAPAVKGKAAAGKAPAATAKAKDHEAGWVDPFAEQWADPFAN